MGLGKKKILISFGIFSLIYSGALIWLNADGLSWIHAGGVVVGCFLLMLLYDSKLKKVKEDFYDRLTLKYHQTEVLSSIYLRLGIKVPLPLTGGWAADPDFLEKIIELSEEHKPKVVVEASSGISSIILGYCLKLNGGGKVYSLEHDIKYVNLTQSLVKQHQLQDYVEIVHAPLKEYDINNKPWTWYDIDKIDHVSDIDLVIVDGPPYYLQNKSRYPAFPLLQSKMSNSFHFLLDDGIREEEKEIARLWCSNNEELSSEYINLISGAILISKQKH